MEPASYSDNVLGLKNNVLGALEGRKNTLNIVVMSQSNKTKKNNKFRFFVEIFPPKSGFWISDLQWKFWALFKGIGPLPESI